MTNEEYKIEFQKLKDNLIDNFAVYHERVTLLIQLTHFDIGDIRVNFKAKIVKPLNRNHAEKNNLYKNIIVKDEISFSASYQFSENDTIPLLKDNIVGMQPYCPFILWLDPDLTNFILENEDDITKQIPDFILWNKDWKVLIK